MKPKVFHLLDDHNMGGIRATTRHISDSFLKDEFDFRLVHSHELMLLLKTERPDILIFRNPSSWRRSLNLAYIKLHVPHVIIHEHHYSAGFTQHNAKSVSRFHAMLRWSYHLADRVVAISQGQANWMQQNHLVNPRKLQMINQCPNLDRFLTMPEKVARAEAEPPVWHSQAEPGNERRSERLVLATYGRFCKQKGFDTLLQAMKLLPESNVHLNIGGSGGDQKALYQLAEGLPHIKFWGAIDDQVPTFLSAADVVIIPSRWEPWGNVCIESRAAGKPIIASDIDGLSEQVQNCGLLVPPDNPQALASAIQRVVSAPVSQLEAWGYNARASVYLAWETYLEKWRSLLWETLQS
jgi:glycosyltransferase involved in cell wall biosynthesis